MHHQQKQKDNDNKNQLILVQVIHCILFLVMGSIFTVMYIETTNDQNCGIKGPGTSYCYYW